MAAALGQRCQRDVPIGARTTYRVGGRAALLWEASDAADLTRLAPVLAETALPVLVLGRGSNLLVADAGFPGLVVVLAGDPFHAIETGPGDTMPTDTGPIDTGPSVSGPGVSGPGVSGPADAAPPDAFRDARPPGAGPPDAGPRVKRPGCAPALGAYQVRAGGAVALPVLARQTVAASLTGLEWAVGVPGSVGGAVRMNAGGHGADTRGTLIRCRLADLRSGMVATVAAADLALGLRRSAVAAHQVVVDAEYQLQPGDRAESEATIRDIQRWRREHQPGGQNAGSVFLNPQGDPPANSAGWLVDAAGLKGLRHGSAMVSTKHANFIQADPGGSADDVAALMLEVQERVMQRLGMLLKAEVRLVGFPEDLLSTLELVDKGS